MIAKNNGLNLKNVVFGVSLIPHRACRLNLRKLKCNNYNKMIIGVQTAMQVSVQEAESLSVSKGLELGFDVVSNGELKKMGFLGLRKTKLVCMIGRAFLSLKDLEKLALEGMNVARLNMCHNTREWQTTQSPPETFSLTKLNVKRGSELNKYPSGVFLGSLKWLSRFTIRKREAGRDLSGGDELGSQRRIIKEEDELTEEME
ncbi:hypothetical protein LguiB_011811 [Lonicera macranthoides]